MHAVVFVGPETLEEQPNAPLVALCRVGGLSLLNRTLRLLLRAGASHLYVLAPPDARIQSALDHDAQLTVPITVLNHQVATAQATSALREHAHMLPERFWLCAADRFFSNHCFPATAWEHSHPLQVCAEGEDTGVLLINQTALEQLPHQGKPLSAIASLLPCATLAIPHCLSIAISTQQDVRHAKDALRRSLRKPLAREADGLVAYFINRPISLSLSRYLVDTPITPNHITTLGLLIGLSAAFFAAQATPLYLAVAGLALQISSIVDGIDGELARMRLTPSHLGEWFDTVCDDVVNIAFLIGISIAAGARTGIAAFPWVGGIGAACVALTVLLFYRDFLRLGIASHNHYRWGFEAPKNQNKKRHWAGTVAVAFSWAAKRDFYTFLLMVVLFLDAPVIAFAIIFTGSSLIVIGSAIQRVVNLVKGQQATADFS